MPKTDPKNEFDIIRSRNFDIFEKLRGRIISNFRFFGSVFDTEKYGYKIFPKFEIFGFFRNLVRDQPFCTIRGMKECEILANGPVRD